MATDRLLVVQKQLEEFVISANDAHTLLIGTSKSKRLSEGDTVVVKSPLSKLNTALDEAVSDSDGRLREARTHEVRVRMMCDKMNLLKCR